MPKKLLLFLFVCLSANVFAKDPPAKTGRLVNDFSQQLTDDEERRLEQKLRDYHDSTSNEIAVVFDNSLEGENVSDYAYKLFHAWKIGDAQKNNGILIYVAKAERKVWITTGYGVEGFLPDVICKRITNEAIKPAFAQQQFYEGISAAIDRIIAAGKGEYKNDKRHSDAEGDDIIPILIILFVIFIIIIIAVKSNKNNHGGGYHRGGRYYDDPTPSIPWWMVVNNGGGGRGFDDDNDSGGGFGGFGDFDFGGGDSGGGGAGGDW